MQNRCQFPFSFGEIAAELHKTPAADGAAALSFSPVCFVSTNVLRLFGFSESSWRNRKSDFLKSTKLEQIKHTEFLFDEDKLMIFN